MHTLIGNPAAAAPGRTAFGRNIRLAALTLMFGFAAAAHATRLEYTLTPANGVGGTYSFTTTQNPVTGQSAGSGFFYASPIGTGGFFAGPDTVFFITSGSVYTGTIQLLNSDFSTQLFFYGPQLFTGTEDAPTLTLGSFLLTNLAIPSPTMNPDGSTTTYPLPDGDQIGQDYNLVVSDAPISSVVPEPSSIALLGTGLIASLGMFRRRLAVR